MLVVAAEVLTKTLEVVVALVVVEGLEKNHDEVVVEALERPREPCTGMNATRAAASVLPESGEPGPTTDESCIA